MPTQNVPGKAQRGREGLDHLGGCTKKAVKGNLESRKQKRKKKKRKIRLNW